MNLQQGRVTLWIGMVDNSPQYGSRTQGLVQVESGDLTLRGIVGEWDVRVLLRAPVRVMDRFIADTETDRWVLRVTDDWVSVSLDFHQLMSTTEEVKCADLSLLGTLAAGGTLRIDRPLDDEWTIVSPTLSPVELIDSTKFVARREQLAQCDALP